MNDFEKAEARQRAAGMKWWTPRPYLATSNQYGPKRRRAVKPKDDEIELIRLMLEVRPASGPVSVVPGGEIADELGMHLKRYEYIIDKWADRGFMGYGVSVRFPWFEVAGVERALGLVA